MDLLNNIAKTVKDAVTPDDGAPNGHGVPAPNVNPRAGAVEPLLFELSSPGRLGVSLPDDGVPVGRSRDSSCGTRTGRRARRHTARLRD